MNSQLMRYQPTIGKLVLLAGSIASALAGCAAPPTYQTQPSAASYSAPSPATSSTAHPEKQRAGGPLAVHGDARIRFQHYSNRFNDKPDLDDAEGRARLNVDCALSQDARLRVRGVTEGAIGLGDATIPSLDRRLQDDTLLDGAPVDYELSVDRAALELAGGAGGGPCKVSVGETDNPLATTIPQLDRDMPIVGAVISGTPFEGLTVQGMYDAGRQLTDDTKTSFAGGQLIATAPVCGGTLSANAGYQQALSSDDSYRLSNSPDACFGIISAGGSFTFNGTPIGPVRVFGEYVHNTAMREENEGWMAGIRIGEVDGFGTFAASALYIRSERDALPAGIANRDTPLTNFDTFAFRIEMGLPVPGASAYIFSGNPQHIIPVGKNDEGRQHSFEVGLEFRF